MNWNHPQYIDPRPKRRKAKDNPYTLFSVGLCSGSPQYYVSFQAVSGHHVCLEVNREVFEAMDRFELEDIRYMNEIDNHYEHSELTEATLASRMERKSESLENIILDKMYHDDLNAMIAMLPPVQRRRLVLHYYGHFTYKQIAIMDGCSVSAVKKSVEAAKKNLKKYLTRGILLGI